MKAEYRQRAGVKYLILRIKSSDLEKSIATEEVGKWACDHDDLVSDCGRCWDCGVVKPLRHPPTNWALPRTAD